MFVPFHIHYYQLGDLLYGTTLHIVAQSLRSFVIQVLMFL